MTATKADPIHDRMMHAFGKRQVERSFNNMMTAHGCNLLDYLTDEAREELIRRCIVSHKLARRYASESRRLYNGRAA